MNNLAKKLLILDLDETLIYATEEKLETLPDFIIGQYYVYKRPFLRELLDFCFSNFEVAIWTSSTRNYAEEIVKNIIDSTHKYSFLWARDRCTISYDAEERTNFYEKKCTKFGDVNIIWNQLSSLMTVPKNGARLMEI